VLQNSTCHHLIGSHSTLHQWLTSHRLRQWGSNQGLGVTQFGVAVSVDTLSLTRPLITTRTGLFRRDAKPVEECVVSVRLWLSNDEMSRRLISHHSPQALPDVSVPASNTEGSGRRRPQSPWRDPPMTRLGSTCYGLDHRFAIRFAHLLTWDRICLCLRELWYLTNCATLDLLTSNAIVRPWFVWLSICLGDLLGCSF
jgi:hypothetical protein